MKSVNLNRREKYAVGGAAGCIIIFLILQLAVFPLLTKQDRLYRALAVKTRDFEEMQALQADYLLLHKKADLAKAQLAKRDRKFSLYRFLETLARNLDIKVSSMKESSSSVQNDDNVKISMVELKLQAITMEQLAQYLYKVEYSENNLFVKRMQISETGKLEGYIDVVLQVETIAT